MLLNEALLFILPLSLGLLKVASSKAWRTYKKTWIRLTGNCHFLHLCGYQRVVCLNGLQSPRSAGERDGRQPIGSNVELTCYHEL